MWEVLWLPRNGSRAPVDTSVLAVVQCAPPRRLGQLDGRLGGGEARDGTRLDLVHTLRLSTLLPAWAGVLNGPRQATQRLTELVLGQMRRRLDRMPGEADAILPLLAGAARSESVRVARAAVAVLARVRALRPDLNAAVDAAVPELHWLS